MAKYLLLLVLSFTLSAESNCVTKLASMVKNYSQQGVTTFDQLVQMINKNPKKFGNLSSILKAHESQLKSLLKEEAIDLNALLGAKIFSATDLDNENSGLRFVIYVNDSFYFLADKKNSFTGFSKSYGELIESGIGFQSVGAKNLKLDNEFILQVRPGQNFRLSNYSHKILEDLEQHKLSSDFQRFEKEYNKQFSDFLERTFYNLSDLEHAHLYFAKKSNTDTEVTILNVSEEVYIFEKNGTWFKYESSDIGFVNRSIEASYDLESGHKLKFTAKGPHIVESHNHDIESLLNSAVEESTVSKLFYESFSSLIRTLVDTDEISLDFFVFSDVQLAFPKNGQSPFFLLKNNLSDEEMFFYLEPGKNRVYLSWSGANDFDPEYTGQSFLTDNFKYKEWKNGIGFVSEGKWEEYPLGKDGISYVVSQKLEFLFERKLSDDQIDLVFKTLNDYYTSEADEKEKMQLARKSLEETFNSDEIEIILEFF